MNKYSAGVCDPANWEGSCEGDGAAPRDPIVQTTHEEAYEQTAVGANGVREVVVSQRHLCAGSGGTGIR